MKVSNYVVSKKIKDGYILFSTISKTIIKVNEEFYKEWINIKNSPLRGITNENLKFLKENYFVIEDNVVEEDIIDYVMNKDRLDQVIFSSYIAFSTLCNFSCVYCYEEGQTERKHVMDIETINETLKWYESRIIENNYKEMRITLFGGEPLIHKELIKIFIEGIHVIAKKYDCVLSLAIVTNGYLLDNDIIDFLNKYNLVEIQITLDGLEEKHDQRRPLRNGGRTFHKIIENVINAKKFNGRFLFRVSFDRNNSNDVKELLNYISKLKISNEYQVYLAPIHNTTSQECMHCSFCNTNVYDEATDIIKQYKELYSYMKYLGLSIPKYYTNGPCMVVSNDTVLIDPYGDIYKCVEMISLKETCVGNVKDKNYNQTYYSFVGLPSYYKCIKNKCKYVCLCGGGCLMANYLKCKKIKGINCEYEYFKELIPFFLEENYDE